jgi:hypothetical protein
MEHGFTPPTVSIRYNRCNVTESIPRPSNLEGEHDMTGGVRSTLIFHRNDGYLERVPIRPCTSFDMQEAIKRVFSISEGLYKKVEIYQHNELIETMENTWYSPIVI